VKDEILVMLNAHHPNVCSLFGYSADNNYCYIVMELMVRDMALVIKEYELESSPPPPFMRRLWWCLELAQGLAWIHSKKIFHNDLKLGNLLHDAQETLHITDFGFAALKGKVKAKGGNLLHNSPERLKNSSVPTTAKMDVFSAGIVMWELLKCKDYDNVPHVRKMTESEFEQAVLDKKGPLRPEIASEWSDGLKNLLQSMWEYEPSKRPNMEMVVGEIQSLIRLEMVRLLPDEAIVDKWIKKCGLKLSIPAKVFFEDVVLDLYQEKLKTYPIVENPAAASGAPKYYEIEDQEDPLFHFQQGKLVNIYHAGAIVKVFGPIDHETNGANFLKRVRYITFDIYIYIYMFWWFLYICIYVRWFCDQPYTVKRKCLCSRYCFFVICRSPRSKESVYSEGSFQKTSYLFRYLAIPW